MMEGKVKSALRMLSDNSKGGVLSLDSLVDRDDLQKVLYWLRNILSSALSVQMASSWIKPPPSDHNSHFSAFDCLDGALIKRIALHSTDAAGPPGVDTSNWRQLCSIIWSM